MKELLEGLKELMFTSDGPVVLTQDVPKLKRVMLLFNNYEKAVRLI